jgi:hypothetical protein
MRLETVGKRYGMRQPRVVRGVTADLPTRAADVIGQVRAIDAVRAICVDVEETHRPGAAQP